jgi:hypothetical protein
MDQDSHAPTAMTIVEEESVVEKLGMFDRAETSD